MTTATVDNFTIDAMIEAAELAARTVERRGTESQVRTANHHLTAMRSSEPGDTYFHWCHGALQGMAMMLGRERIDVFEHEVNLAAKFKTRNPKLDYDTAINNGYEHIHVFTPENFDELMMLMWNTNTECHHSVIIRNWSTWTRGMRVAFETLFTYSEDNEYAPLHVYAF